MADQTDPMDEAVDSAVAAFDVFVDGETSDGPRLLTFDPRTPVSSPVVWREGDPDTLMAVTQAEQETPAIIWSAVPPRAVAPCTAAVDAAPLGRRKGAQLLRSAVVAFVACVAVTSGCAADGSGGTVTGRHGRDTTSSIATTVPSTAAPSSTDPTPTTSMTTTASTTTTTTTTTTATAPVARVSGQPVVVVDPGHNGQNYRHSAEINRLVDAGGFRKACNTTGTAGQGLTEPQFTWMVSQLLQADLTAQGARVVMTRNDNDGWGPCIDARGQVAATNHAAALVSIHADGAAPSAHGFHIIHPSPGPTVTAQTAAASTALATALRDGLVAAGYTPSTYAGRNGLIQRSDLGTLNRAEGPAVIIELGNMRNAGDLADMTSAASRQKMAAAIAGATTRWVAGAR